MPEDAGVGIIKSKILQQLIEGVFLGLGPGIAGSAVLVQATFVDNAEGTVVVMTGVNALDVLRQERNDISVETDVVVVAALTVLGFTTGNQVFNTERAVAFGGGAVNDQEPDVIGIEGFYDFLHFTQIDFDVTYHRGLAPVIGFCLTAALDCEGSCNAGNDGCQEF